MNVLDREKAQALILEWEAHEAIPMDTLLDDLQTCVGANAEVAAEIITLQRRARHAEHRLGERADRAEATIARVRQLCDDSDNLGDPRRLALTTGHVRDALNGGAA